MTDWINMKRKTPAKGQSVLVYADKPYIAVAEYGGKEGGEHYWWPHGWGGYEWEWEFDTNNITHWMPLPEPPERMPEVTK